MVQKNDVGIANPTTRKLPDQDFSYGIPQFKGEEGAYALYTKWHTHTSSGNVLDGVKNYR